MALSKRIVNDNGVTVNYHRVVNAKIFTNIGIYVEVQSYTSEEKRLQEQIAISTGNWDGFDAYIESRSYYLPYEESTSIKAIYAFLKEQPEFEGAVDC